MINGIIYCSRRLRLLIMFKKTQNCHLGFWKPAETLWNVSEEHRICGKAWLALMSFREVRMYFGRNWYVICMLFFLKLLWVNSLGPSLSYIFVWYMFLPTYNSSSSCIGKINYGRSYSLLWLCQKLPKTNPQPPYLLVLLTICSAPHQLLEAW